MANFGYWLGLGAAQATGRQPVVKRRYHIILSVAAGVLLALLIFVGFLLLMSIG